MAKLVIPVLVLAVVFALLQILVITENAQYYSEKVFDKNQIVLNFDTDEFQYVTSQNQFGPGSLKSSECCSQCTRRWSKTQYHKPCMFFCPKCCRKCLCVPSGYYGNKAVCPCYNNWKTKRGGPKCP